MLRQAFLVYRRPAGLVGQPDGEIKAREGRRRARLNREPGGSEAPVVGKKRKIAVLILQSAEAAAKLEPPGDFGHHHGVVVVVRNQETAAGVVPCARRNREATSAGEAQIPPAPAEEGVP